MDKTVNKDYYNYTDYLTYDIASGTYTAFSNCVDKSIIDNYKLWNTHSASNVVEPKVVTVDMEKEELRRQIEKLQKRINELEANEKEEVIW